MGPAAPARRPLVAVDRRPLSRRLRSAGSCSSSAHQFDAAVDEGLRARADDLVAATVAGDLTAPTTTRSPRWSTAGGRVVAGFGERARRDRCSMPPSCRRRPAGALTVESTVRPLRGDARLRAEPAGRYVVVVGTGLAEFDSARRRLPGRAGRLARVCSLVLLTAGAWFLVGAALRPSRG